MPVSSIVCASTYSFLALSLPCGQLAKPDRDSIRKRVVFVFVGMRLVDPR